jgi:FkbM family methyltransferase
MVGDPVLSGELRRKPNQRPLPIVIRPTIRFLLRTWSRFPKAPGYLTQVVERWGARLALEPIEGRLYNGMRMACDLGDIIQRQIYFRGAYEPVEAYLVAQLLSPGMVMIDGGANVGMYTLIAASEVGLHGKVHSFEPVPKNYERLVFNVSSNGLGSVVRTNMKALWHREEVVRLGCDEVGNAGGYSIGNPIGEAGTAECAGTSLDQYVAENALDRVDFMKMDIEGAELFALQGAREVLSRWQPTMLLEINRRVCRRLGHEPKEIWEFLRPFGYSMWAVGESPDECRALSNLDLVDRANVIFHTHQLPTDVKGGWTYKSVLRFHRRRGELINRTGE